MKKSALPKPPTGLPSARPQINGGISMIDYDKMNPIQRVALAILYPLLNLLAMYFAVAFFSVVPADALSMQDRKEF